MNLIQPRGMSAKMAAIGIRIYARTNQRRTFCKYLALKLRWSAIKFWSTLMHATIVLVSLGVKFSGYQ